MSLTGKTADSFRISVVIPHLNQPDHLVRCLAALDRGDRQPDEVIVVDNGSRDLPQAVCAARPGTVLLQEPQPGPGMARNRGVAASTGDILAFIDADCLAAPEWLAEVAAGFSDRSAMILGGDVRIGCVDPRHPTLTEAYESIYAYRMDKYIARQGFTGTGNLAVRREVLLDVGPFAGIEVAEDRDWGQRATSKGYKIRYVAAMRVYHPARTSLSELYRKWDRHLAHDYQNALRARHGRAKWLIKTLAMGPSVIAEVPQLARSDRLSGARARLLAFCGLTSVRFYRAYRMAMLMLREDHSRLSGGWNRS